MQPDAYPKNANKSTIRVLRVLTEFAHSNASLRVTDLVENLGMTKSMVHRALTTLVEENLIVRDENGRKYELGYGVLDLFAPGYEEPDINEICRPFMERLHDITGLTVAFHIPVGDTHVTIDGIEGRGRVLARVARGVPVPLHISPGSRAILAQLSDDEIASYISRNSPLQAATPNTLTDADAIWNDVKTTRANGFTRGLRDHFGDAIGLSFPVLDMERRPHGAITVVGPDSPETTSVMENNLEQLVAVSEELNGISRLYEASPIMPVNK